MYINAEPLAFRGPLMRYNGELITFNREFVAGPSVTFLRYWKGVGRVSMTVNAHFDGRVIIPDEPLDLQPNQALIVRIEPVAVTTEITEGSALSWLMENAVADPSLPTDLADRHDHYLYGAPERGKQG
jgi:hypothetical protein